MNEERKSPETGEPKDKGEYEAPVIESVTTPEELEREVQYAGAPDGTIQLP